MAKKIGIPWEFKYNLAMRGWSSILAGFLYVIRERFGAVVALECIERLFMMEDRVKNLTNLIKTVFKIEGNGIEAIATVFQIWFELTGWEVTWFEQSKTISKFKCPLGCTWITKPKDLSEWWLIISNTFAKAINPKAIIERPMGMCAGDSSCEYIIKIEE